MRSEETTWFLTSAYSRILERARTLGDQVDAMYEPSRNSVYGLATHCVELSRWWLQHVCLGEPTERDRAAEFIATGSVAELESLIETWLDEIPSVVEQVLLRDQPAIETDRNLPWPFTIDGVILHVLEEVYQHAGHIDVIADSIAASP